MLRASVLLAALAASSIATGATACDASALARSAEQHLPEVFAVAKRFALDGTADEILRLDRDVTLAAGRDYRLILASRADQTDVRITVRDPLGGVVAGNALGVEGADEITFRAAETGAYQISFTFEPNGSKRCAGAALGATQDASPRVPGEQRFYHKAWLSSLKPDGTCSVSAHVLGGASFYGDRYVLRLDRANDAGPWSMRFESYAEAPTGGRARLDIGPLERAPFDLAGALDGSAIAFGDGAVIGEALTAMKTGLDAQLDFTIDEGGSASARFDLHGLSDAVAWCDELQGVTSDNAAREQASRDEDALSSTGGSSVAAAAVVDDTAEDAPANDEGLEAEPLQDPNPEGPPLDEPQDAPAAPVGEHG